MTYTGGYILDGKYVRKSIDASELRQSDSSMFKSGDQDRQRKDFAREIIQPRLNGEPNEDFINAYPEEAKQYGFLPTDEQIRNGD